MVNNIVIMMVRILNLENKQWGPNPLGLNTLGLGPNINWIRIHWVRIESLLIGVVPGMASAHFGGQPRIIRSQGKQTNSRPLLVRAGYSGSPVTR